MVPSSIVITSYSIHYTKLYDYLSKSGYLIHGTNKPASIGLTATNGCLRLYPENVKMLYEETPVNTPVLIVNQPYLIGQRNGVLYLEAHPPLEGTGALESAILHVKLRVVEKKAGGGLDWNKIKEVHRITSYNVCYTKLLRVFTFSWTESIRRLPLITRKWSSWTTALRSSGGST